MSQMLPEELMGPPPGGMPMGPPPGLGGPPPMMGPPPGLGGPPPAPEGPPPELLGGGGMKGIDFLDRAMEMLQRAADASDTDDIETADVMKWIAGIQTLKAKRAKDVEGAFGGGSATRVLRRT